MSAGASAGSTGTVAGRAREMVFEVNVVDDQALAQQQAVAIRDVLKWIHNRKPGTETTQP